MQPHLTINGCTIGSLQKMIIYYNTMSQFTLFTRFTSVTMGGSTTGTVCQTVHMYAPSPSCPIISWLRDSSSSALSLTKCIDVNVNFQKVSRKMPQTPILGTGYHAPHTDCIPQALWETLSLPRPLSLSPCSPLSKIPRSHPSCGPSIHSLLGTNYHVVHLTVWASELEHETDTEWFCALEVILLSNINSEKQIEKLNVCAYIKLRRNVTRL